MKVKDRGNLAAAAASIGIAVWIYHITTTLLEERSGESCSCPTEDQK